jgi:hypothetical protein
MSERKTTDLDQKMRFYVEANEAKEYFRNAT